MEAPICYGQVKCHDRGQEWYESASGHARLRAAALRKAGFQVTTSSQGQQVTPMGAIKMTLLQWQGDCDSLPAVHVTEVEAREVREV